MKYEVLKFKKELLEEKGRIQKLPTSFLKKYALWDIKKSLQELKDL
jgi:hypothetical protein